MARDLMLTPTEYSALLRLIESEKESEGAEISQAAVAAPPPRTRKKTKRDRAMSKSLRTASAKAKLKSGAWRKGWDSSRMMSEAHRLTRLAMR